MSHYTLPGLGIVEFNYPHKIVFGPDALNGICNEALNLAPKESKILVVTDKNLRKIGLADRIINPLSDCGFEVSVYDEITSEPTMEMVKSVAEKARQENPKLIIGFGGGSAMDMAKFASVAVTNPGDIKNYITYLEDNVKNPTVPKILIPTTSGTGSEASSYAVVIEESGYKGFMMSPKIVADVAIVDPTLTLKLPPKVTASSGLDALSHGLEAYLSKTYSLFSDTYAYRSIELVTKYLRRAYHHGEDIEARAGMAIAATYGGIAISTPAAVNLGHCLAEIIGPKYGIPHGAICGVVLPYITKFNVPAWPERVAAIAHLFTDEPAKDTRRRAMQVVEGVKTLVEDLNMSLALKDWGVPKEDLKNIAEFVAREQQYNYGLPEINPAIITYENLYKLLLEMYEGII